MDNEMIERCAKAAFDSLADQSGFGLDNENLSEVFLDGEFDLKSVTLAVIKAMREPTAAMLKAEGIHTKCFSCGGHKEGYQALIDCIVIGGKV